VALTLAVVAAVLLGVSDFCAARAGRTEPSLAVTRSVVLVSCVVAPTGLVLVSSEWRGRDILLGAASGVFMIGALLLLYTGYSVARMGVVAPVSSVVLAAIPVGWDVLNGLRLGSVAICGLVVGLVAIVATSISDDEAAPDRVIGSALAAAPGGAVSRGTRAGVLFGLASGVGFGVAFTLMAEASKPAGLVPTFVQRVVGFAMLALITVVRRRPGASTAVGHPEVDVGERFVITRRPAVPYVVSAGVAAMVAISALQLAFQRGATGPVAVASSQFAAVAVLLAVLINRERLRWWQGIGVGLGAVSVALLAVGS
jgi:uncharacterized membrane protein